MLSTRELKQFFYFWDPIYYSNFSEIFNVDWFIKSLEKDVKIVKEVPENDRKFIRTPHVMRVPRKCSPACYYKQVLPVFMRKHVSNLELGSSLFEKL